MKKLISSAVMALCLSSAMVAHAAPAAAPARPVKELKAVSASASLVGEWRSEEHSAQVSPGTMKLTADGRVSLAPDGFDPLEGTYTAQGQFLDLKTGRGNASLIYTITQGVMTLEYEDGAVQNFKKIQPAAGNVKKEAKK